MGRVVRRRFRFATGDEGVDKGRDVGPTESKAGLNGDEIELELGGNVLKYLMMPDRMGLGNVGRAIGCSTSGTLSGSSTFRLFTGGSASVPRLFRLP